ncbi:MAG: hypothetical protein QM796_14125 [Chthoniobacteraceae bacterium]
MAELQENHNLYFVDADCYSRMTRVAMVYEHPGLIIRHHDFENYPQGVTPHTSSVFDYCIAALAWAMKPLLSNPLDWAGALISPLLAVLTAAFLWIWARACDLPRRGIMMVLFIASPILVHGQIFGRPDHQSLQMLLLAIALGAEWKLTCGEKRGWGIVAGISWGLALWVSLYEPLILFMLVQVLRGVAGRATWSWKNQRLVWGIALGFFLLGALVEFRNAPLPEGPDFARWSATIGELGSMKPWNPELVRWVGLGLLLAPVALLWQRQMRVLFALLMAVYLLTLWQLRWGYFFALVFVMMSPWVFAWLRRGWLAWVVCLVSLWPVASEWETRIFGGQEQHAQHLAEMEALREIASGVHAPSLAPWWESPALVYWSHQPSVAGSSHESLPGIVDSAKVFTAESPAEALQILKARGVHLVVVNDPDNLVANSARILGKPVSDKALAYTLFNAPHSAPPFLRFVYQNQWFKVFQVQL